MVEFMEKYLRQELNKMTLEQLQERCSTDDHHLTKEQLIDKIIAAESGEA